MTISPATPSDVQADPIVWEILALGSCRAVDRAEDRHCHDGCRNRGRDGQTDPQPQVRVGRAEDEPEQDARDNGAKGEFFGRQIACAEGRRPSPRGRVSHPVLSFGPF